MFWLKILYMWYNVAEEIYGSLMGRDATLSTIEKNSFFWF